MRFSDQVRCSYETFCGEATKFPRNESEVASILIHFKGGMSSDRKWREFVSIIARFPIRYPLCGIFANCTEYLSVSAEIALLFAANQVELLGVLLDMLAEFALIVRIVGSAKCGLRCERASVLRRRSQWTIVEHSGDTRSDYSEHNTWLMEYGAVR